jgi:hypothetical protein
VKEIVMRYVALAVGVLAVGSSCMAQKIDAAAGRASRMVTDDTGVYIVNTAAKVRPAAGGGADNLLWVFNESISIPENVAMGPASLWVGQHLNNRRLQRFVIAGEGFPANEYPGAQGSNGAVGAVASAKVGDLAVYMDRELDPATSNPFFVLRAYRASGTASAWSFPFPLNYNWTSVRNIKVSRDGAIVCAAVYDNVSLTADLFIINGATGQEIRRFTHQGGSIDAIDINDDASLCFLTQGTTGRLVDTATATQIHTVTGSGVGGYYRISGNGDVLVVGGFSLAVQRKINGFYTPVISFTTPQNWFGAGLAVSRDGATVGVMSHNYATGYVERTVRMWDVPSGLLLGQFAVGGSGNLQGSVSGGEMNDDGSIFAVSSWGTADNMFPEVLIFDRAMQLIGSIDTIGSVFGLTMSADGAYIASGSKGTHANTMGNAGAVSMFQVFAPPSGCYANCDGSTAAPILNVDDFTCFINEFAAAQFLPHAQQVSAYANCDQSTTAPVLNVDDFTCFINAYATGCP